MQQFTGRNGADIAGFQRQQRNGRSFAINELNLVSFAGGVNVNDRTDITALKPVGGHVPCQDNH
jgi:hypothetical protein